MIVENVLHYYIDLLRMKDMEQRDSEKSMACVQALYNAIRVMRCTRHDRICGEDFSRLDFGNIPFNDIYWSIDGEYPCSFSECILNECNLFSGHSSGLGAVAWSQDGKYILTGSRDASVILWNAISGLIIHKFNGLVKAVSAVKFCPDGKHFITIQRGGAAKIWDIETYECKRELGNADEGFLSVDFSSDGKYCLTGMCDNKAKIWNTETGECVRIFEGHNGGVICVAFASNGKYCMTGSRRFSEDGIIKFWNIESEECVKMINVSTPSLAIFSDSTRYLTGSGRGNGHFTVEIRETEMHTCLKKIEIHSTAWMNTIALSPNGQYLLIASNEQTAQIWKIDTGECKQILKGHSSDIISVAFSPDGKYCLTGSYDKTAKIWETETGMCVMTLGGKYTGFSDVVYYFGKEQCMVGSDDNTVKLWDLNTGKCIRSLKGHSSKICSISVSNTQTYCITGSYDNTAKLWELSTGKNIMTFNSTDTIGAVAVSPNSKYCLTGSLDGKAMLWDFKTGSIVKMFEDHDFLVHSVAFSPDGTFFLTGSVENIQIWKTSTLELIHMIKLPTGNVEFATFSPQGSVVCIMQAHTYQILFFDAITGKCFKHTKINHAIQLENFLWFYENKYWITVDNKSAKARKFKNGLGKIVFNSPKLEEHHFFEWAFPYCFVFQIEPDINERLNTIKVWKCGIENPSRHNELIFIDTLYNVSGVNIQKCSFDRIIANDATHKILYQYGADIELPY